MPVPWPLNVISIGVFARCYGIDAHTAVRPELRPIEPGFISPVDGRLRLFESVPEGGVLTQCKGKSYTTADLLDDKELAKRFIGGSSFNFYLSPTDAHHIFSPCDGAIALTRHIPGKLWPVNNWALNSVQGLFAVNERVVTIIEASDELIAVVMVGATNVGRIQTHYTELVTNTAPWRHNKSSVIHHSPAVKVAKGEKIGTFHMGSSVIVLTQKQRHPLEAFLPDQVVRYGESLAE
jgi:phosphatidylserine decarboxylase